MMANLVRIFTYSLSCFYCKGGCMDKVKIVVALCLLVFGLGLQQAEAKEKPSPELYRIFNSFNDLETKIRSENWAESILALVKVNSDYKAIATLLRPTVDAEDSKTFDRLRAGLQKTLEDKDAEGAEKPYIQIQEFFLDIMNRFDYPNPPALMVAARYVKKAKAELGKGKRKEVSGEMEEIVELKNHILAALQEKGASDPNGFFKKVESVAEAVEGGNNDKAAKVLAELDQYLAPYQAN